MTAFDTHANMDATELQALADIFDKNGRVDHEQTKEANREIFSPVNTVYIAGTAIVDKAATLVKRTAAKAVVIARKK